MVANKPRKKPDPFFNLRKVNDIDSGKYSDLEFDYTRARYNKDGTVEERIKIKPEYCVQFGCSKILTREEKLCGDRCTGHQGEERDIFNCLSV